MLFNLIDDSLAYLHSTINLKTTLLCKNNLNLKFWQNVKIQIYQLLMQVCALWVTKSLS